ncbi:MAG: hypothetical protein HFE73_09365 [Firmicutes bacterium]|nr:hypothetical protein [Bacillota bacterium]
MEFTITVTPAGVAWFAITVLACVFLVYLILLLRKLIGTLKQVDLLLSDTKTMTEIASRRSRQMDEKMDGILDTVGVVVDAVKGNQSVVKATTNIVNAASSFMGIVKKNKGEEKEENSQA